MFIFSSNSVKYSFEYKLSKIYRVTHSEVLSISPKIVRAGKDIAAGETEIISHGISNFSGELRDLLLQYSHEEPMVLSHGISNFSGELRDLLLQYKPDSGDPDLIHASLGNVSGVLIEALISHVVETDTIHGSLENITGVLENV